MRCAIDLHEPPVVFLTGPTASGKTDVGIELACRLNAEIVSMDSMAVYRRMDIGTAKPTESQRRQIAHHLVDIVEPWHEYSLSDYARDAESAIADIRSRGRCALVVGGTPLYLKVLLYGVDAGPPPDPAIRLRLEEIAATHGNAELHARLVAIDPAAATRIHRNDRRRIIRALEVFESSGTAISARQVHFHAPPPQRGLVFCLDCARDVLYTRIDARVRRMFEFGFVEEVRQLLTLPSPLSRTARQALGYREVIDHIVNGSEVDCVIETLQRRSRQFAKRQLTWFRHISECRWVALSTESVQVIADRIRESLGGPDGCPFIETRAYP